jgi:hypothetical protein
MSNAQAKCERTGKVIPLSEGAYVATPGTREWEFVAADSPEQSLPLAKSPETLVDWVAHLNAKLWFVPKKLTDLFTRFRKQNNLFNAL